MAKNSIFSIGKSIFNELKDKLVEQSKEILNDTKDELLEKGKDTIVNVANEKVNEFSKGKVNLNQFLNTDTSKASDRPISSDTNVHHNLDDPKLDKESPEKQSPAVSEVDVILPKEDDAKYKDGDSFEKHLDNSLQTLAVSAARNPAEAAMVLKELVNMAGEVSKFTEVQKTKRKKIEADRDKYISKINTQKEVMLAYLDKTFDERKENFEKLFRVVDHALATNNTQALAIGLDSINQLAAISPFKDFANIESTQQALEDKDHIWDI